jgi:formylglycine-generating enzyme required for sulfatase activity
MSFELDQSPYGVFDLGGNAWEWTRDWYDSRYYATLADSTADNPVGPTSSRSKPPQIVVKGGSKTWLAAWREGFKAETRYPYLGFRGVLPLESKSTTTAAPKPNVPAGTAPTLPNGMVPF